MGIIIFLLFFIISYSLNVFYLFNGIVPLFWIPYVLFKIIQGKYKFGAIIMCIAAPIIWNIGLFLFGLIVAKIGLYKYLQAFFNSPGAVIGGLFAIISVLINVLSPQAIQEFKSRLENFRQDND